MINFEKRIMPLEHEDEIHLEAAHGYVDLGMFLDANEELRKLIQMSGMSQRCWPSVCASTKSWKGGI